MMNTILPSDVPNVGRLADVLPSVMSSITGNGTNFFELPQAKSVIVLIIDGLGSRNLSQYSGHARHLYRDFLNHGNEITSVFPTTTVSALSSITLGAQPGVHGMIGYQVQHPSSVKVFNQLSGWETGSDPISPEDWQSNATLFEQCDAVNSYVLADPRHSDSGLTRAILRGATYISEKKLYARFQRALELAKTPSTLVYLYVPNVDIAGHSSGVGSQKWVTELEELDDLYSGLISQLPLDIGLIATADHGMVNVPQEKQCVLARSNYPEIITVAGEPRCLQLYISQYHERVDSEYAVEGSVTDVRSAEVLSIRERLSRDVASFGRVWTRDDLVNNKLFGLHMTSIAKARMGDLFIVADGDCAVYFDDDLGGTGMVGQHGALSAEELLVPFIWGGAYRSETS